MLQGVGIQRSRDFSLQAVEHTQSYHIPRFPSESTFSHLYRHFWGGEGGNKDFGYVVTDAGRMTLGTQGSRFWCPQYLAAQQQRDLACWVTGTKNQSDVLAAFPTQRRLVRLCCLSICPW